MIISCSAHILPSGLILLLSHPYLLHASSARHHTPCSQPSLAALTARQEGNRWKTQVCFHEDPLGSEILLKNFLLQRKQYTKEGQDKTQPQKPGLPVLGWEEETSSSMLITSCRMKSLMLVSQLFFCWAAGYCLTTSLSTCLCNTEVCHAKLQLCKNSY